MGRRQSRSGLADIMSHLVGVRVYQQYAWDYAGLRHLAIHGHQFDRYVVNNVRLNYFWTLLFLRLQKLDLKGKPIARFIDRLNTRWLRMSEKVASGALFHAAQHNADRIFCGHTHVALQQEQNGHHYYNAGGWVDSVPTYITVDEDGVRIREFQRQPDDGNFTEETGDVDAEMAELAGESGLTEDAEYEKIGG